MRFLFTLTAICCLALFGLLLTSGAFYAETYGVTGDDGAVFISRRASPMFLGLAVLLWMSRDLPPGAARDAICSGMAVMWAGIAVTGLYEYATGFARFPIVLAAIAELGLAVAFVVLRRA